MARRTNILTPLSVSKKTTPGAYGDGNNLYLQIGKTGGKSWVLRYMLNGRARKMGLGDVADVPLADARQRATDARRLLLDGKDPIDERRAARDRERLTKARAATFKECAEKFLAAKNSEWLNAKHASQWENTLRDYAYPIIGALPVAEIDTPLVVKVLSPIWNTKTETATRLRGRIESILDWATTRKFRQG